MIIWKEVRRMGLKKKTINKKNIKKKNVKNNNVKNESGKKELRQWFYFCPEKITVTEIRDALMQSGCAMELWREAGVLEINVGEKMNIDVEEREPSFGEPEDDMFLKEEGIQSVFDITIASDSYEKCEPVFRMLTGALGGMVCADTPDFTPRIMK